MGREERARVREGFEGLLTGVKTLQKLIKFLGGGVGGGGGERVRQLTHACDTLCLLSRKRKQA